jgi:hypothetical protein
MAATLHMGSWGGQWAVSHLTPRPPQVEGVLLLVGSRRPFLGALGAEIRETRTLHDIRKLDHSTACYSAGGCTTMI